MKRGDGVRAAACVVAVLCLAGCARSVEHVTGQGVEVYTLRFSYNNAHLVVGEGGMVLVDSGLPAAAEELDAAIRHLGFDPARLRAVIITHGHADHAGGARWFKERYGVPIVAGAGDEEMLRTGRNAPLCSTGTLGDLLYDDSQHAAYATTQADLLLTDAPIELLPLAGIEGQIVPLPGHTPGSLIVVTGDAALVGDLFRGEIGGANAETHFYMCDPEGNRRDVRRLLETLAPDARVFFVGHFGPVRREGVEAWLGAE